MANYNQTGAFVQWVATDTETNATCTATQAANGSTQVKLRHMIYGYTFSFSGGTPAAGTIQIKDGSTVLDQIEVSVLQAGPLQFDYKYPLPCRPGNAATITCGDLGANVKVTLMLRGRTVGA